MAEEKIKHAWVGISESGKRLRGKMLVADFKEAQIDLARQKITLVSLTPIRVINISSRKKKVKTKSILLFTRYLTTMMSAGLPILQALDILAQDKENEAMHAFILNLRSNISSGKTLSESFAQYPDLFGDMYCNLIRAGEKSGALEKILKRLATYLERSEAIKNKIKKAMIYPIAILGIALLVSSILLIFVVPQFQKMFSSLGAQLPVFTRGVIHLSDFLRSYWWLIIIASTFGLWKFKKSYKESLPFRFKVDYKILKFPIFGDIIVKGIIARFARTLSTTIEAGMSISDAMSNMASIMGNEPYKKAIIQIRDDIITGRQLSTSMATTQLFPNMVVQMISVGEASGSLSDMLTKIADYYEEEVNNVVDGLSSLMEPIIMVVLGVLIGGLVIAMYLPIFKLGSIL